MTFSLANSVTLEQGRVLDYQLPENILACMQVLEYDRSFLASRILFDKCNGSLIISGAFGLFKKDTVIAAAIKKEEFQIYLQFVFDPNEKKLCGAEVLTRWHSPEEGVLSPANYIEDMTVAVILPLAPFLKRSRGKVVISFWLCYTKNEIIYSSVI